MKIKVGTRVGASVFERMVGAQDGKDRLKKIKRRIKGGAAAAAVSVGLMLASLFGSPAELVQNESHYSARPAVVQMVDMEAEEEQQDENEKSTPGKGRRLSSKLKDLILGIPAAVRVLVGVPLWAIGWGIISLLSLLWQATGSVVLPIIIKLVLFAAVVFAIIFLIIKAIHPDMPAKKILKKIFRKRNISMIIAAAVILTAADTLLITVWKDYGWIRWLVIFILGTVLLYLVLRLFKRKRKKNAAA